MRATLRRWHIRLGWILFVPIFLWLLSGLVMTFRPMSEVRSEDYLAQPAPLPRLSDAPIRPPLAGERALLSASLEPRADGLRWIVTFLDGRKRMADPATGKLLAPLDAEGAAAVVRSRLKGPPKVQRVTFVDRSNPPHEARGRKVDWRVDLDDGMHLFVNANSGEIVASRSSWWRFYDAFWRIHILDFGGTDDTNNPLLVAIAFVSLVMTVLGAVMLPGSLGRKGRQLR